jgi:hypothetical protein
MMPQPIPKGADVVIEYPSVGMTYWRDVYGVYAYDEYPRSSVLAGQQRRSFIDSFDTLEEAKAAYPAAAVHAPGFEEPYLGHLPDEEG